MGLLIGSVGAILELFWFWVLHEYLRDEEDPLWRMVLVVGNFPGAAAYLIVRKFPISVIPLPTALRRLNLRQKIDDARSAALYIGGAYQHVELGKLLQSVDLLKEAFDAYTAALAKEPANPDALWGVATLEMRRGQAAAARAALESLLRAAPEYQSGNAALVYIRLLIKNDEFPAAEEALGRYLKTWNEPEARYFMARLLLRRQETAAAVKLLEEIAADVRTSAPVVQIRDFRWLEAAERILSGLKGK